MWSSDRPRAEVRLGEHPFATLRPLSRRPTWDDLDLSHKAKARAGLRATSQVAGPFAASPHRREGRGPDRRWPRVPGCGHRSRHEGASMSKILFVVTGATHWTLKDGTQHPTGYWAEELLTPYRII